MYPLYDVLWFFCRTPKPCLPIKKTIRQVLIERHSTK